MSPNDGRPAAAPGSGDEDFLERWSRRKAEARSGSGEHGVQAPDPAAPGGEKPDAAQADSAAAAAPAVPLPDLDTLGEDSDYSAFLAQGVDAGLRRTALRKLFQSPKFNVLDGLDDYMGDYTSFEPLGSLVTADMRYQLERTAKRLAEALDTAEAPGQPASASVTPPAAASDPPAGTDALASAETEADTRTDTNTGAMPDDRKPPAA